MEKRGRELKGPGRGFGMNKDSEMRKHMCTPGVVSVLI